VNDGIIGNGNVVINSTGNVSNNGTIRGTDVNVTGGNITGTGVINATNNLTMNASAGNLTVTNLSAGNVTLNRTGTANGSVAVTGSGTATRTVTVSSISVDMLPPAPPPGLSVFFDSSDE
jgi:hypothetical protein